LIYLFHVQRSKVYFTGKGSINDEKNLTIFINAKKWTAVVLVPILLIIALYSFIDWSVGLLQPIDSNHLSFKNINNIFFEQFFNILIIADVILLIFSFFHTDKFHKVIRNSGFIISTILIRVSFSVNGIINPILIVSAVLFGLLMMYIHNMYEHNLAVEIISEPNKE
jgi:hypothetical protein